MGSDTFEVTPASKLPPPRMSPPEFALQATRLVDDAAIAAFETDGVVCLRQVLNPSQVEALREGADASYENPGPLGYKVDLPGQPGAFYYDFNMHERLEAFRWLVFDSHLPEVGAALMRSPGVTLYYSNMFIKRPGASSPSPWHEDASYQRMNGLNVINFWIALDWIPSETALMFKRASHRRHSPVYQAYHFDGGKDYDHPVITRDRVKMPTFSELDVQFETIWWELGPGDAVVFTQRTLHAAPGNTRSTRRRAANLMLLGDDVTYNAAAGESDPPFKDDVLEDGQHPAGDIFVRLR